MTGQELIDWIIDNGCQNATIQVTALIQYDGDHDCPSTEDFDLMKNSEKSVSIYVGTNLQS
jgi:hypothetical protein